jgi:hypothetical protein
MNKDCEKTTAHSQNILHGDTLYNIKRKKCKTVYAELAFTKVNFDRMVMICFIELHYEYGVHCATFSTSETIFRH